MATGTAATNYTEQKVLEHALRNIAWTSPTTVYTALFTASPDDAGGGTEVSGGSYAREATTFGAYSGGQCANSADTDFGTATADWGTIVAVGIFDAITAGNLLFYGAMTVNKVVSNGDSFKFVATKLSVALD